MLRSLKNILDLVAGASSAQQAPEPTVGLATAVLLVEVMRAEDGMNAQEKQKARELLAGMFQLAPAEIGQLLASAKEVAQRSNDFHTFTSVLNDRLPHAQKIDIVEQMWRVVLADAHLAAGEMHVISKIAGLLHVTHGEYIAAKLRAKEAAG